MYIFPGYFDTYMLSNFLHTHTHTHTRVHTHTHTHTHIYIYIYIYIWRCGRCTKFVPRVLREDQKERRGHDRREMVELINSDPAVLDALVTCVWKLDLLLWPRDQETEFPVEACWLSETQEGQTEQIHPQTFDDPFFDSTGMINMHSVPTGRTVNKEYYVVVLREFRKRFHWKRPVLFKSGQWYFHQDNAPVHNSILVTDYLTKMGI